MGERRFKATNVRGGVLPIGWGDDPDFTPVELLLAALAGCGAIDLEWVTDKRAPFASFAARAEGHKVRDEQGTHLVNLSVTIDVTFPDGEAGDQAREVVPRTLQQIEDRLCTVGRTVSARRAGRVRRRARGARTEHGGEDRAETRGERRLAADLMAKVQQWREVPRQDGRRFVVTGASSGIGLETARALAAAGAQVVLGVRNLDKGKAAADRHVRGRRGRAARRRRPVVGPRVRGRRSGRSTCWSTTPASSACRSGSRRTASSCTSPPTTSGTSPSPTCCCRRLTDRVVVVGSASHRSGELDLDDLLWERRRYVPYAAYGASKLANLLFLAELQRRLTAAGSTLRVTGAHPGTTSTHITSSSGSLAKQLVGKYGHRLVGMPSVAGCAADAVRRHDGRARQHLPRPARRARRCSAGRPRSAAAPGRSTRTSPRRCGPSPSA